MRSATWRPARLPARSARQHSRAQAFLSPTAPHPTQPPESTTAAEAARDSAVGAAYTAQERAGEAFEGVKGSAQEASQVRANE